MRLHRQHHPQHKHLQRKADAAVRPDLQLSLQFADARHRALLPRHRVVRWLRAALAAPGQITVRIVGAEEGLALNRDFRGQDHATNVLTFDYEQAPVVIADLVLCAPVVESEAKQQHIDLIAHYAHLLVHGALHAQGFDHLTDAEAALMEARESALLVALGFADPYERERGGRSAPGNPGGRRGRRKAATAAL
jgi:probable rRNA maturation factor